MHDAPLERAELRRKAEDGNARHRIGLFLQVVSHALGQAFYQRVKFGGGMADHVRAAIRGLECRAPHLASALFIEAAESLHEAGDKVGLGEQHIDLSLIHI